MSGGLINKSNLAEHVQPISQFNWEKVLQLPIEIADPSKHFGMAVKEAARRKAMSRMEVTMRSNEAPKRSFRLDLRRLATLVLRAHTGKTCVGE